MSPKSMVGCTLKDLDKEMVHYLFLVVENEKKLLFPILLHVATKWNFVIIYRN